MSRCTIVFLLALAVYLIAAVVYDVRELLERRRSE
jgi:hypothetical protein